jgi:hypothetical protein
LYERGVAGELIHIDIKTLGRIHGGAGKRITGGVRRNPRRTRVDAAGVNRKIIGWDYVHIEERLENAQRGVELAERLELPDLLSQAHRTHGLLQSAVGIRSGSSRPDQTQRRPTFPFSTVSQLSVSSSVASSSPSSRKHSIAASPTAEGAHRAMPLAPPATRHRLGSEGSRVPNHTRICCNMRAIRFFSSRGRTPEIR